MKKIFFSCIVLIFFFCLSSIETYGKSNSKEKKLTFVLKQFKPAFSNNNFYEEGYCLATAFAILDAIFNQYEEGLAWCMSVHTTGPGLTDCFNAFTQQRQDATNFLYQWLEWCECCSGLNGPPTGGEG